MCSGLLQCVVDVGLPGVGGPQRLLGLWKPRWRAFLIVKGQNLHQDVRVGLHEADDLPPLELEDKLIIDVDVLAP